MKRIINFIISILLLISISGCTTLVHIESNEKDALVSINNERIGRTPVSHELSDFILNNYSIRIEKDGFETYSDTLNKEIKIVPLLLFWLYGIPLLWSYGPNPNYYFELVKVPSNSNNSIFSDKNDMNNKNVVFPLSILEFKIDENSKIKGVTGKDLALYMESYLSKSDKISLSNRINLDEVFSEVELMSSDIFNSRLNFSSDSFSKSNNILIGQVKKIGETYSIFIKIIDITTNIQSKIFVVSDIDIAMNGINALKVAMNNIANDIIKDFN